jgi:DNA-binding transcriptional ArsR family regulator
MSTQQSRSRDDGAQSARLSKDTIFSMLSNQRRRYVLYYLHREPGPVSLSDLAERIAAWENDIDVANLEYKQRKRVYTSLHQTHLPKLDDAGIVAYDRDEGTITLADRAHDLDVYLELVGEHDVPWCDFYLGLSVVVSLFVGAAWLGVFPFAALPGLALAGSVTLLFGGFATVHSHLARRNHIGGDDAPIGGPDD